MQFYMQETDMVFVSFGPPSLCPLNALKFIYIPPKGSKKKHIIWAASGETGTITICYIDL